MENAPAPLNNATIAAADSGDIRPLGEQQSRRICTGQVIISLAGACRELIDNAMDAGATNIEIRVTENGLECLEVIDNGTGISPPNFERLCKAHCTSKLSELDDFRSLTTFGFRGEALNALAALGDVQITTRDASSRCATRLTFGRNGEEQAKEQCSRSQGTTVRVAQLFKTLPVRRMEFQRQARREFLRLVDNMQAFALASPGCRFSCSNSVNGGKRLSVLSTPGGPTTRLPQVLDSLFGDGKSNNNGLLSLEETVDVPGEDCLRLYGVPTAMTTEREKIFAQIRVSGYVSSCQSGHGRCSADRQFVFVNQRHVDFSKLCRIANEVYAQFNRGRFCCLVLFVDVPAHTLDVNISPDKRTVFLHHEKEVFAKLRASLFATFAKCQGAVSVPADQKTTTSPEAKKRRTIGALLRRGHSFMDVGVGKEVKEEEEEDGLVGLLETDQADANRTHLDRRLPVETQQSVDLSHMAFSDVHDEDESLNIDELEESPLRKKGRINRTDCSVVTDSAPRNVTKTTPKLSMGQKSLEAFSFHCLRPGAKIAVDRSEQQRRQHAQTTNHGASDAFATKSEPPNSQKSWSGGDCPADHLVDEPDACASPSSSSSSIPSQSSGITAATFPSQTQQQQPEAMFYRPQQTVRVDMNVLRQNFADRCSLKRQQQQRMQRQNGGHGMQRLHVEAAETATSSSSNSRSEEDTEAIERRLSLMLKKTDFARMHLIGQFNNAFIIVRLRSDVFIVDQHAADEKYNFERLLTRSVIKSQRLIRPQRLHLGTVNAALVRDNLKVFRANGFDFQFNGSATTAETNGDLNWEQNNDIIIEGNDDGDEDVLVDDDGQQVLVEPINNPNGAAYELDEPGTVLLTAVPVHHGWQLNKDDIDQLVSLLIELPGAMHRPAKVRKIFASKACRHSVMFGKALTQREMETIIVNMGSMDQPWNCPHGRPTVRHLCTIGRKC